MSEMKPCPCGAECNTEEGPYPINREQTLFRLDCVEADCGWCIIAPTSDQAMIDWNRRTPQPVTPAGGEVGRDGETVESKDLELTDVWAYHRDRSCAGSLTPEARTRHGRMAGVLHAVLSHPPVADAALLSRLNALADDWERAANVMKVAGNIRRYPEDYISELRAVVKDAALNQRGGG